MKDDDFQEQPTNFPPDFPLNYSEDAMIVMHRDSHFAGNFGLMLDYYKGKGDGVGVMEEFSLRRIEELAAFERLSGGNIAPLLLTGADAERIALARQLYRDLRQLYEMPSHKSQIPKLIADLILSEDAEATAEVTAIAAKGDLAIPALLELLGSENMYDPLFPGYGLAPSRALTCLQLIGDKRAIIALFEMIGSNDFFNEEKVFTALRAIGEPAKEFLLRILKSHPITGDNERAAMALIAFKDDESIAKTCLEQLQQPLDWRNQLFFATYLVLACEGLSDASDRDAFASLLHRNDIPKGLHSDIKAILTHWQSV